MNSMLKNVDFSISDDCLVVLTGAFFSFFFSFFLAAGRSGWGFDLICCQALGPAFQKAQFSTNIGPNWWVPYWKTMDFTVNMMDFTVNMMDFTVNMMDFILTGLDWDVLIWWAGRRDFECEVHHFECEVHHFKHKMVDRQTWAVLIGVSRRSSCSRRRCRFHIKWPLFSARILQNAPTFGENVAKKAAI